LDMSSQREISSLEGIHMSSLNHDNHDMSYMDIKKKPESERWELIDGVPLLQAAPSWQHQFISRELTIALSNYLNGSPCQVFAAPFDVLLSDSDEQDDEVKTVVQPDLTVVCDSSKLRNSGYRGNPRLVIEIISPSTARADRLDKMNRYARAGVPDYWIVQPDERTFSQYHLNETGMMELIAVVQEHELFSDSLFPGFIIPLTKIFPSDARDTRNR